MRRGTAEMIVSRCVSFGIRMPAATGCGPSPKLDSAMTLRDLGDTFHSLMVLSFEFRYASAKQFHPHHQERCYRWWIVENELHSFSCTIESCLFSLQSPSFSDNQIRPHETETLHKTDTRRFVSDVYYLENELGCPSTSFHLFTHTVSLR